MTTKRRSTVHDLAALRLHPDGSRAQNVDTNTRLGKGKAVARDVRGNWIARDAGGSGRVKQQRTAAPSTRDDQDRETFNLSGLHTDGDEEQPGPEPEGPRVNVRARKRRRFNEDLGFLEPPSTVSETALHDTRATLVQGAGPCRQLSTPSSDLLKCIHYFASTYYDGTGQLYDATREVRRQRKQRRLQRQQEDARGSFGLDDDVVTTAAHLEDDFSVAGSSEDESEVNDTEAGIEDANGKGKALSNSGRGKLPTGTDMYKIFDGSALMAIGMLFQEHVAGLLRPNIPEGWEEEMAAAERQQLGSKKKRKRQQKKDSSEGETDEETDEDVVEDRADDVEAGCPQSGIKVDESSDEEYVP